MELIRLFQKTPLEIGEMRRRNPAGISFVERRIIYEAQEREKLRKKQEQEMKRKSKRRHR